MKSFIIGTVATAITAVNTGDCDRHDHRIATSPGTINTATRTR